MRNKGILGLSGIQLAFLASVFALASCGGVQSGIANSAIPATPALPSALRVDVKLSGERFSSSKAKSSCSGSAGTFQASGKAKGPFPGTFSARGQVSEGLIFHEKFEIRSGSVAIYGSAYSQASGSPTSGCSKSGKLSFDFPILQYRERHSKASGTGYAALSGANFGQGFE